MAFEKAASIEENKPIDEPLDAANTLQDAFKAYGKSSPEDAARVLQKAINFYLLKNPRRAATQLQALAKHCEELLGDEQQAMESYKKAANLFEKDNAQAYGSPSLPFTSYYFAILIRLYHFQAREQELAEGGRTGSSISGLSKCHRCFHQSCLRSERTLPGSLYAELLQRHTLHVCRNGTSISYLFHRSEYLLIACFRTYLECAMHSRSTRIHPGTLISLDPTSANSSPTCMTFSLHRHRTRPSSSTVC